MKKNYSKKRSRRYARRSTTTGKIRWIFLGALLTLIAAVIVYSANKHNHHRSVTKSSPARVAVVRASAKKAHPVVQKSEFDFYTMLPKMQVEVNEQQITPPVRANSPPIAQVAQAHKTKSSYVLQVASLKNFSEADRMRAQLIMMGFGCSVQKYLLDGQVWYRIYIGPYNSRQAALHQQLRLRENSVSSILVKQDVGF